MYPCCYLYVLNTEIETKPDPDLDPTLYLEMFLMFSKINIFLWHFPTKSEHPMTLKIKDKKYLNETVL